MIPGWPAPARLCPESSRWIYFPPINQPVRTTRPSAGRGNTQAAMEKKDLSVAAYFLSPQNTKPTTQSKP
jgi:hypothetical protein